MASRPLPPGRRGRGSRTTSALHLPDIKLMDAGAAAASAGVAEQIQSKEIHDEDASNEPEHESIAKQIDVEPKPIRSVKAFVASLESSVEYTTVEPARPVAAAAGEMEAPRVVVVDQEPQVMPVAASMTTPPVEISLQQSPTVLLPERPIVNDTAVVVNEVLPVGEPVRASVVQPLPSVISALKPIEAPPAFAPAYVILTELAHDGFHPFQLLLPVYSVPEVPESVDCVYDDEAVEMQKNIMKTVKKFFGKDRAKLEDFKINARLYGNNFMDPHEYVEYLATDFGGNRALQLVPCLLSLQPDLMKRNSLLVAARAYRLRTMAKLEAACDRVALPRDLGVSTATAAETPAPVARAPDVAYGVQEASKTVESVPTIAAVVDAPVPSNSATVEISEPEALLPAVFVASRELCEAESIADIYITTQDEPASEVDEPSPSASIDVTDIQVDSEDPQDASANSSAVVENDTIKHQDGTISVQYDDGDADEFVTTAQEESATEPTEEDTVVSAPEATLFAAVAERPVLLPLTPLTDEQSVEAHVLSPSAEPNQPVLCEASISQQASQSTPTTTAQGALAGQFESSHPEATPVVPSTLPPPIATAPPAADGYSSGSSSATPTNAAVNLFGEAVPPLPPKPIRRQSTINLFGEDIGNPDDDDSDDEIRPVAVKASPPVSPPAQAVYEAESLFGEVISASANHSAPVSGGAAALPRPTMLFGFGSTAADSDSDSDSDFSD